MPDVGHQYVDQPRAIGGDPLSAILAPSSYYCFKKKKYAANKKSKNTVDTFQYCSNMYTTSFIFHRSCLLKRGNAVIFDILIWQCQYRRLIVFNRSVSSLELQISSNVCVEHGQSLYVMMHRGFYTDSCRFMPISTREVLPSPIERNKAIQSQSVFSFCGLQGRFACPQATWIGIISLGVGSKRCSLVLTARQ